MLHSNYSSNTQNAGLTLALISSLYVQHYTQLATLYTSELSSFLPASHHTEPPWFPPHFSFWTLSSPLTLKDRPLPNFCLCPDVFLLNCLVDHSHSAQIIPKFLSSPRFDLSIGLKLQNSFGMMLTAWMVERCYKWKIQFCTTPAFSFSYGLHPSLFIQTWHSGMSPNAYLSPRCSQLKGL